MSPLALLTLLLAVAGVLLNAWPFAAPALFPDRYLPGETTSVRVSYVCTVVLIVAGVLTIVVAPDSVRGAGGILIAAGLGHQVMFYFGIIPAAEQRGREATRPVRETPAEEIFYRA